VARFISRKSKPDQDCGSDKVPPTQLAAKEYSPHPLTLLFPTLDDDAFGALCADIKKNGQVHPIIVLDGQILDGVHRYRACLKIGVAPMIHQFSGNNPAVYVLSANLHRRHLNLTTAQKRELISRVLKENPELSNRHIAKITKASDKTVAAERAEQELRSEIRTSPTRKDTKGRQQPAKKSKSAASLAQPAADLRAKHTVKNGESPPIKMPSGGRGSGTTTTSAAAVSVRLLIDLLAQGVKADPAEVGQLVCKKLRPEQIAQLFGWLGKVFTTNGTVS